MKLIETYIVPKNSPKVRLSDISAGTFNTITSRKAFKKAIKAGLIKLNSTQGYTADYISPGDIIHIYKDEFTSKKPSIHIPLNILYEDDYLAIIHKPAGVEVSGNKKYTIENALPILLKVSTQADGLQRPLPAHRLDYPTSGCLLIGKTSETLQALHRMFEQRIISKKYLAVTIGHHISKRKISEPIDGKASESNYTIIETIVSEKYDALNFVVLEPVTGRRHQLRKHLSAIGNPILGDKKYGIAGKVSKGNGLYLHATTLQFKHPRTGKPILCYCPPPKKFSQLFKLKEVEKLSFTKP